MNTHSNKRDEKFSNSKKLIKHIARQHGSDGTYQCRLCQELESVRTNWCWIYLFCL